MPFVDDLLEQASGLVRGGRLGRPRQADLRRGVSSAYYALFHTIVDGAIASAVRGSGAPVDARLRRTITHSAVKTSAGWFASGKQPPRVIADMLGGPVCDPTLTQVCTSVLDLQEERHRADYDLASSFRRAEAERLVSDAKGAVAQMRALEESDARRVFLLGCLLGERLSKNPG